MYFEKDVTITPGIAREFLSRNVPNNRPQKKAKIASYARDMAAGAWQNGTGETIKFNTERQLIDGQNRLHAVIVAGVPVKMDIAHDVSMLVMPVIDTGAKRSNADALSIAGPGVRQRNRLASIVRWVIMWEKGFKIPAGGAFTPTHAEIVERHAQDPGLFDAATARGGDVQRAGLGNATVAGVAYFLLGRVCDKDAFDVLRHKVFFDALLSGVNLEPGSPIVALSRRLMKAKIERPTRPEELYFYVRSWNAWRNEEVLDRLNLPRNGLTNENFPDPK
jgi:hypothetical protein